ncbi:MAG: hypothetical protein CMC08_07780 [Flavobacteriaceae bacterium]|nr:hypothetical protein [Flavobacteriaceae bacterium]
MKIVISPAKTLDFESELPVSRSTQPFFLKQAETINKKLERKTKKEIGELMDISEKLADLNYQRYKEFSTPFSDNNARPAVFAFSGDVYQGLDAYSLPKNAMDRLQETLRILSGMYGLLRPFDLIQPYRLEMGTNLKIQRDANLYEFWGDTITEKLNDELSENELFVNLASQEYFKVIKPKKLKAHVMAPVFKDFKNGKLKIISFFAKKARGSMVRYILETDARTKEDILGFNYDGYRYSESETENAQEPVFIR